MDELNSITVKLGKNESELEVINPTNYELIGKGFQGAIFRLSEGRCVKIFVKKNIAIRKSSH